MNCHQAKPCHMRNTSRLPGKKQHTLCASEQVWRRGGRQTRTQRAHHSENAPKQYGHHPKVRKRLAPSLPSPCSKQEGLTNESTDLQEHLHYEALMTCDCQTHKLQAKHSKRLTPSLIATRSEHSPVRQGMGTSARAVKRADNLCENT